MSIWRRRMPSDWTRICKTWSIRPRPSKSSSCLPPFSHNQNLPINRLKRKLKGAIVPRSRSSFIWSKIIKRRAVVHHRHPKNASRVRAPGPKNLVRKHQPPKSRRRPHQLARQMWSSVALQHQNWINWSLAVSNKRLKKRKRHPIHKANRCESETISKLARDSRYKSQLRRWNAEKTPLELVLSPLLTQSDINYLNSHLRSCINSNQFPLFSNT